MFSRSLDPISFFLSHEQIWIFFPNVMFLFAETRGMSKARLVLIEQESVFFRFETRQRGRKMKEILDEAEPVFESQFSHT